MARWAIGDIQGCCEEFDQLLRHIGFSADRDRLWLVGDLVNRGPCSLQVLRRVRSLGDNALCVLGNHDLHLLAVALSAGRERKRDTLTDVLGAPDRDVLLEWLLHRPLAHYQPASGGAGGGDLLVHAAVAPQWDLPQALAMAVEVQQALRREPRALLAHMYGDRPRRWRTDLGGYPRLRFAVNAFTRMRFCTAAGSLDLTHKGSPAAVGPPLMPWFEAPRRVGREVRIIFGHWSALGWYRAPGLLGLDTGCVWGGSLTAVNLDDPEAVPHSVPSRQRRSIEG